jgi:ribosomal protein S18 acetylase RimI-like enzyme
MFDRLLSRVKILEFSRTSVEFDLAIPSDSRCAPPIRRARKRMTYIRRFRMEIDVASSRLAEPRLPEGFGWVAWHSALLSRHAAAKFYSFRDEIDSRVFPCLGDFSGCKRLMQEIVRQETFLADATWLITNEAAGWNDQADCATIQGLAHSGYLGAVQNVGVLPQYRGLGLGRALVLKSLHGFRAAGLHRVYLEVTGENVPAVELYRSIGFELVRTMYKSIEPETVQNY